MRWRGRQTRGHLHSFRRGICYRNGKRINVLFKQGETTIYNAACEPYLQQLCKMLNNMGAKITGIGSNMLKIKGVKSLGGCYHRILPDMIEIGSFIGLAAMTRSEIRIKDVSYPDLGSQCL